MHSPFDVPSTLVVLCQDSGQLLQPLRLLGLQHLRDPVMKLAALAAQKPLVHDVADQGVAESEQQLRGDVDSSRSRPWDSNAARCGCRPGWLLPS